MSGAWVEGEPVMRAPQKPERCGCGHVLSMCHVENARRWCGMPDDTRTLIYERENWNRLYHEAQAEIAELRRQLAAPNPKEHPMTDRERRPTEPAYCPRCNEYMPLAMNEQFRVHTCKAERQVGERLSERAVFVDGIGPPLSQIREDNVPLLPDSQQARDIVNLIDAYLSLARQLAEAERENGLHATLETFAERWESCVDENLAIQVAVRQCGHELRHILDRAALNPPDPPASPAEGSEAATEVEA